jgi:hypothetical protein
VRLMLVYGRLFRWDRPFPWTECNLDWCRIAGTQGQSEQIVRGVCGRQNREGSSRCSTEAWNASMSQ